MINARYIARLYGLDPDYIEAFCRWLCGLGEYFDQLLGVYSTGMKARFTFSLMLAWNLTFISSTKACPAVPMPNSTENPRASFRRGYEQPQSSLCRISLKYLKNLHKRQAYYIGGNYICAKAWRRQSNFMTMKQPDRKFSIRRVSTKPSPQLDTVLEKLADDQMHPITSQIQTAQIQTAQSQANQPQ